MEEDYPLGSLPSISLINQSFPGTSVESYTKTSPGDSCTLMGREEMGEGIDSSLQDYMEPFAQPVESETISDVIPTYSDVLQNSKLPVYMGGSIIVDNPSSEGLSSPGSLGVLNDDPKGCIRGGLDPEFSPLKTRNARRLKGLLSDSPKLITPTSHIPRALREQKALARGLT